MHARKTTILSGAVIGILALALLLATGASSRDEHCTVRVIGQEDSGQFILSEEECFDTYDEMLSGLEEGTDADFIIGAHYEHSNLGGSSFTVVGSGCTGGWLNVRPSWNDRISSTANGSYRISHWEHQGTSGAEFKTRSPYGNITGVMNDQTSSISYHSS